MANFYVNPVSGNDANDGSSWANARKTISAIQTLPGLAGGDTIYVAATDVSGTASVQYSSVNIGDCAVTNGSNRITPQNITVVTLWDRFGSYVPGAPSAFPAHVVRNTSLASASSSDFVVTGTAETQSSQASYVLSMKTRNPSWPTKPYVFMGTLRLDPVNGSSSYAVPTVDHTDSAAITYLVLKVRRNSGTRFGVSFNLSNLSSPSTAAYPGSSYNTYVTLNGTDVGTQVPVLTGKPFGTAADGEVTGDDGDLIAFNMKSTGMFSPNAMSNIAIFAKNETGASTDEILGIYIVRGDNVKTLDSFSIVETSTAGGNLLVGYSNNSGNGSNTILVPGEQKFGPNTGGGYRKRVAGLPSVYMRGFSIDDTSTGTTPAVRGTPVFSAVSLFPWDRDTGIYKFFPTYGALVTANQSLSAGGVVGSGLNFKVIGGINTTTGLQAGTTRFIGAAGANRAAPGPRSVEFYLRSATLSGMAFYNFDTAVKLKLNNTRGRVSYTFEDISSNNVGISLYSDDGTCPQGVYIRYRDINTNNVAYSATPQVGACTGWTINEAPRMNLSAASAFTWNFGKGLANIFGTSWSAAGTVQLSISAIFQRLNAMGFTLTAAGASAFAQSRNRGFAFSPSETSAVAATTKTNKALSFISNAVNSFAQTVGVARQASPQVLVTAQTPFEMLLNKGIPWSVSGLSAVVMSYMPVLPLTWASAETASILANIKRNRGYQFTVEEVATMAENLRATRAVAMPVVETAVVAPKLMKSRLSSFAVAASAVIAVSSVRVARTLRPVVNAVATVAEDFGRSRPVTTAVNALSTVTSRFGRSRPATWTSSTASAMVQSLLRIKPVQMTVNATQTTSVRLLRRFTRSWTTVVNTSQADFANNELVRWATSTLASVSAVFGRERPTTFSAAELMSHSWKVGVNKKQEFAVSQTSSVAETLKRNRGYAFTIPMSLSMQADLARLVGEEWVSRNEPVVSVVLGKGADQGFNIISQSGNTMVIEYNKMLDYILGATVTIDGTLLTSRPNSTGWGASSAAGQTVGVGRGVRFVLSEQATVPYTMTRQVQLGFISKTQSTHAVRSNSNRLDEFYVQFEEPFTYSMADGSIVIGQTKVVSSGVLQDAHPVFNVTLPAPEVINVTIREDD